jgi:hypothetical protein
MSFRAINRAGNLLIISLVAHICSGQEGAAVALHNAQFSLAIPVLAASNDVLYVAYRSFNLLKKSSQLEVSAYDLKTKKELQHSSIPVPDVHGARVSNGMYLSRDGKMLAYTEAHVPYLVLLLSTGNLSEVRRSTDLPFTTDDRLRVFVGFDKNGFLAFASNRQTGQHFFRFNPTDLSLVSDTNTGGPHQAEPGTVVWSPDERVTWVCPPLILGTHVWKQYTESGQETGQELHYRGGTPAGGIAVQDKGLLAFFGQIAEGEVISYNDHHSSELKLKCAPTPYGASRDPEYAGAICTTQRDVLPEAGGDKIVTSEFLLLKTDGAAVVWSHKMDWVGISEGTGFNDWFQKGDPLIYRAGSKLWIVAPSKSPALTIYEIDAR